VLDLLNDDPYRILGVARTATEVEIKHAYFALVRQHPPERDPAGFKRIRAAYEKLRNPADRAQTDLFQIEDHIPAPPAVGRRELAQPAPTAIRSDLLALEAFLLFEDALAQP
jgi:curved DNA-binding protein CbpA